MATEKQQKFIQSLCDDLQMTRIQRNAFISLRIGRPILYLDENHFTVKEASNIIEELLDMKDLNYRGNSSH